MDSIQGNINRDILLQQLKSNPAKSLLEETVKNQAEGQPGNILQSFGEVLKDQMSDINRLQQEADQAVQTYAVGGPIDLHQVILATEKAETSLQLAIQVRNKLIQAYQEISRMQV